jgi:hypothetical protein
MHHSTRSGGFVDIEWTLAFAGVPGDMAGGFGQANRGICADIGDDFIELLPALIGQ